MAQPSYKSRVVAKIPQVGDIVTFQLERPRDYDFKPGQWFVITFPGPYAEPYVHHFSHSNSPLETNLEFTTRLRSSEFKNALDALPLGAEVEVEGPYGRFTLSDGATRVAFAAGGIGITCVRSILRGLAGGGGPLKSVLQSLVVLYANRSENSIPFRLELGQLEGELSGLRIIHVISRPGKEWRGYRGHIDRQILAREFLEPTGWTWYVSGPPSFVQSIREELTAWGVTPAAIKVEAFDGYE